MSGLCIILFETFLRLILVSLKSVFFFFDCTVVKFEGFFSFTARFYNFIKIGKKFIRYTISYSLLISNKLLFLISDEMIIILQYLYDISLFFPRRITHMKKISNKTNLFHKLVIIRNLSSLIIPIITLSLITNLISLIIQHLARKIS